MVEEEERNDPVRESSSDGSQQATEDKVDHHSIQNEKFTLLVRRYIEYRIKMHE